MKTYILILSRTFPAKHTRKGEPTNFDYQILNAVWREHNMSIGFPKVGMKLHTIRGNYDLWSKRFEQIYAGNACLSIRYWTGRPYHSKQTEICKLTKDDGIGLQRLEFYNGCLQQPIISSGMTIRAEYLAKNDGLSFESWKDWFKSYDLSKPLAVIQFTKFRY